VLCLNFLALKTGICIEKLVQSNFELLIVVKSFKLYIDRNQFQNFENFILIFKFVLSINLLSKYPVEITKNNFAGICRVRDHTTISD